MAVAESDESETLTGSDITDEPKTSIVGTILIVVPLLLVTWIFVFLLQVLVALLTCALLCTQLGRQRFHHIQSRIWRGCNGFFMVILNPIWGVHLIKAGNGDVACDETGTGTIFFCNHRSNADPWICAWVHLMANLESRFIYKSTLGKLPLAGCCLRLAGDLPARFGDKDQIKEMLEQARDLVRDGYNVFVFPEGTRSPSGLLQDFKPTFFQICAELGCPAVPLVLLGTEQAWPHGGMKVGCAHMTAVLGEPIMPDETGAEGLVVRVREAMGGLASLAFEEGALEADDPLLTGKPYPWWTAPEELQDLSEEEQLQLLRSGKTHAKGKNLF